MLITTVLLIRAPAGEAFGQQALDDKLDDYLLSYLQSMDEVQKQL